MNINKTYIAGPLFTTGERQVLEQVDRVVKNAGRDTYLPHRDGGIFLRGVGSSLSFFKGDTAQLDRSDLVVAVLNGPDIDSGTSWEIGYAFSKGKKIIGYCDDTRVYAPELQINPMIFHCLDGFARDLKNLERVLNDLLKNEKLIS